jgi:predicted GIY-YIG superfamily endonuclease
MNMLGRTIQIYLPNGDPSGIRVAELTTSVLRVVEIPRHQLNMFLKMPESSQVGLYLLFSENEENSGKMLYIGQSGDLKIRLTNHHQKKDFWNKVLVVLSLTNNMTQTHALYLEWLAIERAQQAGRYQVLNLILLRH